MHVSECYVYSPAEYNHTLACVSAIVHWAGQTIMGRLVALAMWATSHIADGALLLFQETRASLDAVVPALLQETPDAKRSYIIGIVTLNL